MRWRHGSLQGQSFCSRSLLLDIFLARLAPLLAPSSFAGLVCMGCGVLPRYRYWGYNAVAHSGLRFFAGLPLMARFLGAPIGEVGPVLIIIVNIASLLYAGILNRLVIEETGDAGLGSTLNLVGVISATSTCIRIWLCRGSARSLRGPRFSKRSKCEMGVGDTCRIFCRGCSPHGSAPTIANCSICLAIVAG